MPEQKTAYVHKGGPADVSALGVGGVTPASQQAHVTDASVAHALAATYTDTEIEAALDALGTKINSILSVLEAFGLTATS